MSTEKCLLGLCVESSCGDHKFAKKCIDVKDLSEEDLKILKYRVPNFSQNSNGNICPSHISYFLTNYSSYQKNCSDPFKKHKYLIRASLREISLEICENLNEARNIMIPPGNKVCINCYKSIFYEISEWKNKITESSLQQEPVSTNQDENNSQISSAVTNNSATSEFSTPQAESPESTGYLSESQEQKLKEAKLKRVLDSLDLSMPEAKCPKVSNERHEKYYENFTQTVVNCVVSQINDTFKTRIDIQENEQLRKTTQSLESILENIKNAYENQENSIEKIKLITLFPIHWTYNKIKSYVDCSSYMIRKANMLRLEKGVLGDLERKKFVHYSEDLVASIQKFYRDNSRICAGTKEKTSVRDRITNEKEKLQTKLILGSARELYDQWIEANMTDLEKVPGFSFFASLRPKDCKLALDPGTHTVCVCEEHQNPKLKCRTCSPNLNYRHLLSLSVCSMDNEKCMMHNCPKCPGPEAIRNYLDDLKLIKKSGTVTYYNWAAVNIEKKNDDTTQNSSRVTLRQFTEDAKVFYDQLLLDLWNLTKHHFISECQKNYCEYIKNNLEYDTAILMMDFAENYTFIAQDSTQKFYYNNMQATVHPFVLYYRDSNGKIDVFTYGIFFSEKYRSGRIHRAPARLKKLKTYVAMNFQK